MKKFKFQLETLLKVTQRKKDETEMQFALKSSADLRSNALSLLLIKNLELRI